MTVFETEKKERRKLLRIMCKTAILLLLVLTIVVIPFAVRAQIKNQTVENCSPEMNNFKLCTISGKISTELGKDVELTVLVKNAGNKDIVISNQTPIEIKVFDEMGNALTKISRQIKAENKKPGNESNSEGFIDKASISHRYGVILGSQQSWKKTIKITKEYDLNEKGKYFVEIKSKLPNKQQNGFVELTLDKLEINIR